MMADDAMVVLPRLIVEKLPDTGASVLSSN